MRINHNLASLNTYRQLASNTGVGAKSLAKLSSGLRINSSGDDAAGLAISEKMRGQIRGLDQASRNAQDGISLMQTAEGALNETHSILQRMRELAVQSANDTSTADDRTKIQSEVDELAKEITRVANTTEFNTQKLLDGGIQSGNVGAMTFHIGANASQNVSLSINAMDAYTLGVAGVSATAAITSGGTSGVVSSATVARDVGTGIVNGASISVTAADVTAAVGTSGACAMGSCEITIATTTNTDALNGYTVKFADGTAAISTTVDTASKVNTVTADWDSGTCAAPASCAAIAANINTALTGAGFTAQISVSFAAVASVACLDHANAVSGVSIASGADGSYTRVTLGGACTIDVKDTETSFTVSTSTNPYKGLTVNLTSGKATSDLTGNGTATIAITATGSAAASFTSGTLQSAASAGAGINVSGQSSANTALTTIDTAIKTVSSERSKLGAYANRMEHTINNLGTSSENIVAAESRVRDVDMAKEMMEFTKNNILSQAAQAMLAQANQQPQGVLQLLR